MATAIPLELDASPAPSPADGAWLAGFAELMEEDARRTPSPLELERRELYGHDLDLELTDFAAGRHPVQRPR